MRILSSGVLGVLTVSAVLGRAAADGDSQSSLANPHAIAVGEAVRGGGTGASAIGFNPATLPLDRQMVFAGSYGYRTGDSASLIGVSGCDSTNRLPGCFFYNYIGASPDLAGGTSGERTTHVGGVALSRVLVPRVMIGATAKYYHFRSDITGEADADGFVFDFGATLRITDQVNLGVSGQNLFESDEQSPQFPRTLGGGVFVRPAPTIALGFDTRWRLDDDHSARYGGGGELALRAGSLGLPIRAGGLHDNGLDATYLSGGVGLAGARWGIDITGRLQVDGGDETLVIGSLYVFGPRYAPPQLVE